MLRAYIHGYPNLRAPAQPEWPAMNSDFTDWTTGSTNQLWPRDFYSFSPAFLTSFSSFVCIIPIFVASFTNWTISLKRRALPENGHGGLKPVLDKWTQKLVPSNQQLSERLVHNMAFYLFFFTLLTVLLYVTNSHSFIKVVLKGLQNSIPTTCLKHWDFLFWSKLG